MDNRERERVTTDLSTLNKKVPIDNNEFEVLKVIYGEVNSNYRNLADIRFKLLGFLPAFSGAAWIALYSQIPAKDVPNILAGIAIAILGIGITSGIRIYDIRNNELYNDIVSRGKKIEEEFGVSTGLFLGRLKPSKMDILFQKINHGRATSIIYSSVFVGWWLLILWYIINIVNLL